MRENHPDREKNSAGTEFEFVETYSQLFCEFCPLKVSKRTRKFIVNTEKPTGAQNICKDGQQNMTITFNKHNRAIESSRENQHQPVGPTLLMWKHSRPILSSNPTKIDPGSERFSKITCSTD